MQVISNLDDRIIRFLQNNSSYILVYTNSQATELTSNGHTFGNPGKVSKGFVFKRGVRVFINPRLLLHGVSVHERSTPMLTYR